MLIITDLYLTKYLKNLFLKLLLSILINANCSQNMNPVSHQLIYVQINNCLLFMTYPSFDADSTRGVFLQCPKLLTKFDMMK